MKLLIISNSQRGIDLINYLNDDHIILAVVPKLLKKNLPKNIKKITPPKNINDIHFVNNINKLNADVIIVAGFNQIISKETLKKINQDCLNLHAGELPSMRGSSPLNWALIKNHKSFSINIIKIDGGIDSGDIIKSKKFPINFNDNIATLHNKVNKYFPIMVKKVLENISKNTLKKNKQKNLGSYYPIRFKEDGIIIFDYLTALEVHNKVRALEDPYPNAYSYYKNKKVNFIHSRFLKNDFHGEPGRIYQILNDEILVCAKDKSLWLTLDKNPSKYKIKRYEKLATFTEVALSFYENK